MPLNRQLGKGSQLLFMNEFNHQGKQESMTICSNHQISFNNGNRNGWHFYATFLSSCQKEICTEAPIGLYCGSLAILYSLSYNKTKKLTVACTSDWTYGWCKKYSQCGSNHGRAHHAWAHLRLPDTFDLCGFVYAGPILKRDYIFSIQFLLSFRICLWNKVWEAKTG